MKKTILVTGGAGYIGSAAVRKLCDLGHEVVVVDNLKRGQRRLVDRRAVFIKADLTDEKKLALAFRRRISVVMHFAAYKAVEESMSDAPMYSDNIKGTVNLLNHMVRHSVPRIIYSSSAAVYGMPNRVRVDEHTRVAPISFYGYTKAACEELLEWYRRIHRISCVSLRYFNVAGDAGLGYVDPHAQNVFPIVMEVLAGKRDRFVVFGRDYSTHDGTCVRDYIDINDLVDAHVLAIGKGNGIINLGTQKGVSVMELLGTVMRVTGTRFRWQYGRRREGDPARLVASNRKARAVLGWLPKRTVEEMVRSTLAAYREYPRPRT